MSYTLLMKKLLKILLYQACCLSQNLRQQLLSNADMLGKVLEWLKYNNVSVVESADDRLKGLAKIFRGESSDEDLLNYLEEVKAHSSPCSLFMLM